MQSSPFRFRLPIPELPLPSDTVCYKVILPNSPRILEAFEGSVQLLSRWVYWQASDDHAAIVAANVFKRLYEQLRAGRCNDSPGGEIEDEMKLRIDPDNDCIVQVWNDCDQDWCTFLDVSACVPGAAGQGNPGGTPGLNTTSCYDILIQGNSQWISPIPVQDGDTIVISSVGGGWFDGAAWFCPNGLSYALGLCTGSPVFSGSDPNPAIAHARLIGTLDGGSSWNDAYNLSYPVPPGQTATNFILQMNDPSLSDNGGSIHCRVCITHQAPVNWTQDFDFTLASGGWNPLSSAQAQWLVGVGWTNNAPGITPEDAVIQFTLLHSATITVWTVTTNVSAVHQSYQNAVLEHNSTFLITNPALAETPGGTLAMPSSTVVAPGDVLTSSWNISASPLGTATQVSMHFEGTGVNPFLP